MYNIRVSKIYYFNIKCIFWSVHYLGFDLPSVKTKNYENAASPLNIQQEIVRANASFISIRIMCEIDATCLHLDCCCSTLAI